MVFGPERSSRRPTFETKHNHSSIVNREIARVNVCESS